ncbi:MAG: bacillithiol biosynthesis cysteine-adding enzyme BshC [Acidobacteria bacterium OLB17]|nr:MAG: bacillithiol biosynthesis cysteine-adding enzyme BshC [Acidobacteria bacterium OLB17]MCZ2391831.1 bacillithiol biosynthesis cysteine-adding enzyme BshC [Acidobacteriota bacterium]
MTEESACPSLAASGSLRVESIPFSRIPGQSKLFIQYQTDRESLRRFYPNAPNSLDDICEFAGQVTAAYKPERNAIADALAALNRSIDAGERVRAAIERLREPGTVAVFTGQQSGLFGGPLYTIYKALTAIKAAAELTRKGTPAVAMFWAATEDHDFDEVASVTIAGNDELIRLHYSDTDEREIPVGGRTLTTEIGSLIAELEREMPQTEFSREAVAQLRDSWTAGEGFGRAFLRQLAKQLGCFGMIFVDPQDAELKRLSAPIMRLAAEKAPEITAAIRDRDAALAEAGLHRQVLVEDNYFPLFWQTDDGIRTPLRLYGDGVKARAVNREFSIAELCDLIEKEPERFSAGVMLRAVVQDYLFPTVLYVGGAAEIAYFAQSGAAYEVLQRPATPIVHRQSFTVVEPRHQRTFAAYDLKFDAVFEDREDVRTRVVEQVIGQDAARLFAETEEEVNIQLRRLDEYFAKVDPTLAANLAKRRRKMLYHIAALRKKAYDSEIRRNSDADRRLRRAFEELYPGDALQERTLNIVGLIDRYGIDVIDWIYSAIDLDDKGHRVIYL